MKAVLIYNDQSGFHKQTIMFSFYIYELKKASHYINGLKKQSFYIRTKITLVSLYNGCLQNMDYNIYIGQRLSFFIIYFSIIYFLLDIHSVKHVMKFYTFYNQQLDRIISSIKRDVCSFIILMELNLYYYQECNMQGKYIF